MLLDRIKTFVDPTKSDQEIRDIFFEGKKSANICLEIPEIGTCQRHGLLSKIMIINIASGQYLIVHLDTRYVYYHNDMIDWSRDKVMRHLLEPSNYAILVGRQGQVVGSMPWNLVYISDQITDLNLYYI